MKSIAFFNNKGGVGKTTLLCNLGGFLSRKCKKKILVVDADPQCNTTTYVLDDEQFYSVYFDPKDFTVSDFIPPLEDGEGFVKSFKPITTKFFGFDLIPGNPTFAVSEDFLAGEWKDVKSSDYRGIRSTLFFAHFLTLCEEYDFVLFDMGPSLGAINRSILLACDYFVTPMSSDVFSLLALGNIGKSIGMWRSTFLNGIRGLEPDKEGKIQEIPHTCDLKFLGYVEQQYITKSVDGKSRAVKAYDEILKQIPQQITEKVVVPINGVAIEDFNYKIGSIPNYHSLVPMSQTAHKPIFDLSGADGVVGAHYQKVKEFSDLMDTISVVLFNNMEVIK